jgi:hypothetical protein
LSSKGTVLTEFANLTPRDWKPGRREMIAWNVLGAVILIVVTSALFSIVEDDGRVEIGLIEIVAGMLVFALLMVAHELIHGLFMRLFGGRPEYGLMMIGRTMPAAYCTSPGTAFTRREYLVISLAPLLLITALGILALASVASWVSLAIGIGAHAGGAIGDLWATGLVLRSPRGTRLEDLRDGIRFIPPDAAATKAGAA